MRSEKNRTWKVGVLAPAALALVVVSSAAWGTLISFTGNGTNANNPNEAVSAQADFNVQDGLLTITLTNLLAAADLRSAGQALSDISFDLSDDIGTVGTTTAAGTFGDVDVSNGGAVTIVATDTSTGDATPVRWLNSPNTVISGTHILLEAIGGGAPSQLILPSGTAFPIANASVENINSSVIGPGTFTLQLSGITENTTISNVFFSFGTGPDTTGIPGVPIPTPGVPEPGALALLGLGLIALVASRRKLR